MNCEKAKELILSSDGDYGVEIKAHIVKCDECREIAEEWSALKNLKGASRRNVPKSLDFAVVNEADIFIKSRAEHTKTFYRWLSFVSAAACVALFALAVFAVLKDKTAKTGGSLHIVASTGPKPANSQEIPWEEVGFYYETSSFCEDVDMYMANMTSGDPDENLAGSSESEFIVNIEIPEFLT